MVLKIILIVNIDFNMFTKVKKFYLIGMHEHTHLLCFKHKYLYFITSFHLKNTLPWMMTFYMSIYNNYACASVYNNNSEITGGMNLCSGLVLSCFMLLKHHHSKYMRYIWLTRKIYIFDWLGKFTVIHECFIKLLHISQQTV